jgi:hypothetical protein
MIPSPVLLGAPLSRAGRAHSPSTHPSQITVVLGGRDKHGHHCLREAGGRFGGPLDVQRVRDAGLGAKVPTEDDWKVAHNEVVVAKGAVVAMPSGGADRATGPFGTGRIS